MNVLRIFLYVHVLVHIVFQARMKIVFAKCLIVSIFAIEERS